jgi:hypothetical protein
VYRLAGHFTERERNRILGHEGSAIFEKYYHDNCIRRDIQNVVLFRPTQENLCRSAAQMNRHRDHLAPSELTEDQLEHIRNSQQIRSLQEKRLALTNEIRALHGTVKKAQHADPDRYREHEAVVKELTRVRSVHRRERKVEFREAYFNTMPGVEIDKQIDQLLGKSSDVDSAADVTDTWEPPVPEYPFVQRARITDAFFGPEAENLTLDRRIEAICDLVELCNLREQPRRGKPFNWNKVEETANNTAPPQEEKDPEAIKPSPPSPLTAPPSPLASPRPCLDQCPFCFFEDHLSQVDRERRYSRKDSLRRYVLRVHLNQASRHDYGLRGLSKPHSDTPTEDGPIICPVPACGGLVLEGHMQYMNHSARVHNGPF